MLVDTKNLIVTCNCLDIKLCLVFDYGRIDFSLLWNQDAFHKDPIVDALIEASHRIEIYADGEEYPFIDFDCEPEIEIEYPFGEDPELWREEWRKIVENL